MKFIQAIQLVLALEMATMIPSTMARLGGAGTSSNNAVQNQEKQEEQGDRELWALPTLPATLPATLPTLPTTVPPAQTALTLAPKLNPLSINDPKGLVNTPEGTLDWNTQTTGEVICGVTSTFDPTTKDRVFGLKLCTMVSITNHPSVYLATSTVESNFSTNCPKNRFVSGINGNWDATTQDRSFAFSCSELSSISALKNCKTTSTFVNDYEKDFAWDAPANSLVAGVQSQYDATTHDRIFKFTTCEPFIQL